MTLPDQHEYLVIAQSHAEFLSCLYKTALAAFPL